MRELPLYLEILDQDHSLQLPFSMLELVVPLERFAVMGSVVQPRKNSLLLQFLTDRPDDVYLFTDAHLQGKDALFVARLTHASGAPAAASLWLTRMTLPGLSIRTVGEDTFMVAPLANFGRM